MKPDRKDIIWDLLPQYLKRETKHIYTKATQMANTSKDKDLIRFLYLLTHFIEVIFGPDNIREVPEESEADVPGNEPDEKANPEGYNTVATVYFKTGGEIYQGNIVGQALNGYIIISNGSAYVVPFCDVYYRWRAVSGQAYFCIGSRMEVVRATETCADLDDVRWSTGNYFRTQSACREAIDDFIAKHTSSNTIQLTNIATLK